MVRIKKKYSCSQPALLSASTLIVGNCQKRLTDFDKLVPGYYTPEFFTALNKKIASGTNLPELPERTQARELANSALIALSGKVLQHANVFERYIIRAFKDNAQEIFLKPLKTLRKTTATDWDARSAYLQSASINIKDNLAAFTTKGFMPATFAAETDALRTEFDTKLADYRALESAAQESTGLNTKELNDLYESVRIICDDGQTIYADVPEVLPLFVFDSVVQIVSGNSIASLRGRITNKVTGQSVSGASITILGRDQSGLTAKTGRYTIKQLAEGQYTLRIEHPDYLTVAVEDFMIEVGTANTLNVALMPLVAPSPEEVLRIKASMLKDEEDDDTAIKD